jgi:hypothetical protein
VVRAISTACARLADPDEKGNRDFRLDPATKLWLLLPSSADPGQQSIGAEFDGRRACWFVIPAVWFQSAGVL